MSQVKRPREEGCTSQSVHKVVQNCLGDKLATHLDLCGTCLKASMALGHRAQDVFNVCVPDLCVCQETRSGAP